LLGGDWQGGYLEGHLCIYIYVYRDLDGESLAERTRILSAWKMILGGGNEAKIADEDIHIHIDV